MFVCAFAFLVCLFDVFVCMIGLYNKSIKCVSVCVMCEYACCYRMEDRIRYFLYSHRYIYTYVYRYAYICINIFRTLFVFCIYQLILLHIFYSFVDCGVQRHYKSNNGL